MTDLEHVEKTPRVGRKQPTPRKVDIMKSERAKLQIAKKSRDYADLASKRWEKSRRKLWDNPQGTRFAFTGVCPPLLAT